VDEAFEAVRNRRHHELGPRRQRVRNCRLDVDVVDEPAVTLSAMASWMAGSRASGPTVSTYWSVSSSVLRAHTPIR
jgi:hypothetical protein